jgi:hypothetical protein
MKPSQSIGMEPCSVASLLIGIMSNKWSMPNYIQTVLDDFNHVPTNHAEHQPHCHNPLQYGVKTQLTDPIDVTAPLDDKGNLQHRQVPILLLSCRPHHERDAQHTGITTNTWHPTNKKGFSQIPQLLHDTS